MPSAQSYVLRYVRAVASFLAVILFGLMAPIGAVAQSRPVTPPSDKKHALAKKSKQAETFVLVGAGDIASCKSLEGAEATAKLIENIPGEVFAAGDLAYEKGTAEEFKNCYDKTWVRKTARPISTIGAYKRDRRKGVTTALISESGTSLR